MSAKVIIATIIAKAQVFAQSRAHENIRHL
jgi:hypothetical protein